MIRDFARVSRRGFVALAVVATLSTGLAGGADAKTSKDVKVKPPTWSFTLCTNATNDYMNAIWESNNDPQPGVDYDFEIEFYEKAMNEACFNYAVLTS